MPDRQVVIVWWFWGPIERKSTIWATGSRETLRIGRHELPWFEWRGIPGLRGRKIGTRWIDLEGHGRKRDIAFVLLMVLACIIIAVAWRR